MGDLTNGITGAYTPRIRQRRITPPQNDCTNGRVYKDPVHSLVGRFRSKQVVGRVFKSPDKNDSLSVKPRVI